MTVKDLIEELKNLPQDETVYRISVHEMRVRKIEGVEITKENNLFAPQQGLVVIY